MNKNPIGVILSLSRRRTKLIGYHLGLHSVFIASCASLERIIDFLGTANCSVCIFYVVV